MSTSPPPSPDSGSRAHEPLNLGGGRYGAAGGLGDEEFGDPAIAQQPEIGRRLFQVIGPLLTATGIGMRIAVPLSNFHRLAALLSEIAIGTGGVLTLEGFDAGRSLSARTAIFPISVELLQILTLGMLNAENLGPAEHQTYQIFQAWKTIFSAGVLTANLVAYRTLSFGIGATSGGLVSLPTVGHSPAISRRQGIAAGVSTGLLALGGTLSATFALRPTSFGAGALMYGTAFPFGALLAKLFTDGFDAARETRSRLPLFTVITKASSAGAPVVMAVTILAATKVPELASGLALAGGMHGAAAAIDLEVSNRRPSPGSTPPFTPELIRRMRQTVSVVGNVALGVFIVLEMTVDPETSNNPARAALGCFMAGLYTTYAATLAAYLRGSLREASPLARAANYALVEHRVALPVGFALLHAAANGMNDADVTEATSWRQVLILINYFIYGAQFGANRVITSIRSEQLAPLLFIFLTAVFFYGQFEDALTEAPAIEELQ